MTAHCRLRMTREDFDTLVAHLFPGDREEHGAVLLAGLSRSDGRVVLHVREVHLAVEGVDYVPGKVGHRALTPSFIHRLITRARDERLVYLAVHNHGSDSRVSFSPIDMESHERGYPALLQIARGLPVGALVFGQRSVQADLWLREDLRMSLDHAVIVGNQIRRLFPHPSGTTAKSDDEYDRQVRMFGLLGQAELAQCRVGIVGLGGVGSLLAEYLARVGVGRFVLVDDDRVETSNLSRIVGADRADALAATTKVAVATRVIMQAKPDAAVDAVVGDVAKTSVARTLTSCDYLFLAADSMRARLVLNALVHQYLIPGVQLGSKIRPDDDGTLLDVMSANRPLRPGRGCLWCNQLVDPHMLAKEAKTDKERRDQAYGVEEPNPSVITLNAIAAAHAANDFLLDYLGLRDEPGQLYYEHFHFLKNRRALVEPRKDPECTECSRAGRRFAQGDGVALPCAEG